MSPEQELQGDVVLLTGMSGGGKSVAMHALEDAGFEVGYHAFAEDRTSLVARIGADEFGVLFVCDESGASIQSWAERLLTSFKGPVMVGGESVRITASTKPIV